MHVFPGRISSIVQMNTMDVLADAISNEISITYSREMLVYAFCLNFWFKET